MKSEKKMPRVSDRAKHKVFTSALRGLEPGEAVEIPKTTVRRLPSSYEGTALGIPPSLAVARGQQQYRGPWQRHVYETPDSWVVHRDIADPRQDPIQHLAVDAPEIGAGLLVGGAVGIAAGRSSYQRALEQGLDSKTARRSAAIDGLIAGGVAGLAAGGAVWLLRTILKER